MGNAKLLTIDCDGVLSATAESLLSFYDYKINDQSVCLEDMTHHRFHEIPKLNLTFDESVDLWHRFYEEVDKKAFLPEPKAKETIQYLHDAGYRMIVLTARTDVWKSQTLEWIEYYFPGFFEDVIFTNDLTEKGEKKGSIAAHLGSSLHIDDHIDYAMCTCNHGIQTYLFDQPWNKAYEVDHALMKRVDGWSHVLELL